MQYLDNKYTKWYFNIICKAKDIKIINETEHHHVMPSSIFQEFRALTKHKWNGVHLTHREHFICHWLLTKMFDGLYKEKMLYALSMMQMDPIDQRYRTKITSRVFAQNKKELNIYRSIRSKARWANKTQEEKDIMFAAIAKKHKANWQNKSAGEKDEHAARTKDQWLNKSQTEKDAIFKKVRTSHKIIWENKTQEEKDAHANKFKKIWENKTQEEKDVQARRSIDLAKNRSTADKEKIAQKRSISVSKLRWYNDGVSNRRVVPGSEPIGFRAGRLPNRKRNE